ncbi:hypothetical protein ACVNF4_29460, partial [Streptomyces sp. S6]
LHRIVPRIRAERPECQFFIGPPTAETTAPAHQGIAEEATAAELAALPRVTGLKDGLGDLESLHRIVPRIRAERPECQFFIGPPTAETTAPAHQGIAEGDTALAGTLLDEFRTPFVAPTPEHPDRLAHLLDHGLETVAA